MNILEAIRRVTEEPGLFMRRTGAAQTDAKFAVCKRSGKLTACTSERLPVGAASGHNLLTMEDVMADWTVFRVLPTMTPETLLFYDLEAFASEVWPKQERDVMEIVAAVLGSGGSETVCQDPAASTFMQSDKLAELLYDNAATLLLSADAQEWIDLIRQWLGTFPQPVSIRVFRAV